MLMRSDVWVVGKISLTYNMIILYIITYTAHFVLKFVPWLRQWNVLPLLVLVTQIAETKAVQSCKRLPWHGLLWMASF